MEEECGIGACKTPPVRAHCFWGFDFKTPYEDKGGWGFEHNLCLPHEDKGGWAFKHNLCLSCWLDYPCFCLIIMAKAVSFWRVQFTHP